MSNLLSILLGPLGLIGTIFWGWMFYDCMSRGGSEKREWLWIFLFLNVAGAVLYFFVHWLPRNSNRFPTPSFMQRWSSGDALRQAEAAAQNIGNAYQYAKLGNILVNIGEIEKASSAFQQALDKEPKNVAALWGIAQIEIQQKNFESAKSHLQLLLKQEPEFLYGEASLAYGLTFYELQDWDGTITHFQAHVRSWSHPQGYLSLANAYKAQSHLQEACATLESMISRIKSSPTFQYRKQQGFMREGEKLLKIWSKQL